MFTNKLEIMSKSNLEKGFYPISITDVKRYIKNCEQWGYGNKDTCKYVAESVIEALELYYEEIPIKDTLYQELINIVHDINSGSQLKEIKITLVN
jgi:hypothetical protein